MAVNTIERAVRYLKEPAALEKTLEYSIKTKDLEVENQFVGADTIRYQRIEFDDYDLGSFDRNSGYAKKGIRLTWETKKITQDMGDSIFVDKMDDEEAMANGIVLLANRYIQRVQAPSVDKYRFRKMRSAPRANYVNMTLTAANIIETLLAGRTMLINNQISMDNTILYISATHDAILETAAFNKGYISVGNWNGNMDATARMFKESMKVVVPDSYFGDATVQAILLAVDALPAMKKYQETEYFDKIPGYGKRRVQADIGLYHECFDYAELNRAIVIFGTTSATTKTVTYAGGAVDGTTATGTAPTQAAIKAGGTFALAANAFELEGYTFVGWDDGSNLYAAGKTYSMPNSDVTLTARWKKN